MQAQNAHLLVAGLMESNDGKYDHLLSRYVFSPHPAEIGSKLSLSHSFSTAIAMRIAYGHQIVSDTDEYIKLSNAHISSMSECGNPGANPVDFFPVREYFSRHIRSDFKTYSDRHSSLPPFLVSRNALC